MRKPTDGANGKDGGNLEDLLGTDDPLADGEALWDGEDDDGEDGETPLTAKAFAELMAPIPAKIGGNERPQKNILPPETQRGAAPEPETQRPNVFTFSDNPTIEEFEAFAKWDRGIAGKVQETHARLARQRAEQIAIDALYEKILPDPPPLARPEAARSTAEAGLVLGRVLATVEHSLEYLLEIGAYRNSRELGHRVQALGLVSKAGASVAAIGRAMDQLAKVKGKPAEPKAGEEAGT